MTVFLLGLALGVLIGAVLGVWMKTSDEEREAPPRVVETLDLEVPALNHVRLIRREGDR